MSEQYTPTTEEVRIKYGMVSGADDADREFDRWLEQVKADAWDEGYSHCFDMERRGDDSVSKSDNPYRKEQEYDGL